MKYLSAIFLVLLIAPFAYSQRDIIEMIEKSPEGKQVLDKVFLEVAVQGKGFNHNFVKNVVHAITSQTSAFSKGTLKFLREERNICVAQLKQTRARFNDFTQRAVYSRNALAELRKGQEVKSSILRRTAYLYNMYKRFLDFSRDSQKQWSQFWTNGRQNYRKISSLVSQIRAHVRRLHRQHKHAALVQLPKDYEDAMVEISTQFEQSYDDLNGLRPVISNLLEIVRSPVHLKQKKFRVSARKILGWLAYNLHEWSNTFDEENEHQKGMFEGLVGLYTSRVNSQQKVIKLISAEAQANNKKISHVADQAKQAANIAQQSQQIVDLVIRECNGFKKEINAVLLTTGRILNYASQLEEVVLERWPSLKSYFLEKLEEIEERA